VLSASVDASGALDRHVKYPLAWFSLALFRKSPELNSIPPPEARRRDRVLLNSPAGSSETRAEGDGSMLKLGFV
jgi:hypothetical protein